MEIRENPFVRQHAYDVAVAAEHGIAAALLYREIGYWCASNAARGRNLAGGRAWMYRSLHEFAACYPELSLYAIRRALRRLVSAGLILEASCNRMTADRTKWYTTQTEPLSPDAESLRFTEKENAPLKASRRYADPADVLPDWAEADMEPGSASLKPAEENADPTHADAKSTNDNSDPTHADPKSTNGNSISTNGDAKSTNAFVESDKPIPTRNPTRTPTLKEYSYTTSTTGNSPRAGTEAPKAAGGGGMPDVFLIPDGEPFKTDDGPGLSAPGGPLAIQGPPSCESGFSPAAKISVPGGPPMTPGPPSCESDFPPAARTSAPCGPPAIPKPPPAARFAADPFAAHLSAAHGDLSEALYAYAREAAAGARYPAAYARAVLDRLRREGFRTLEEVRDSDRRFRSRSGPGEAGKERPVDPALDYLQRDDSGYRDVEYWIDLEKWAERNGCA